jgi:hypothetical protein
VDSSTGATIHRDGDPRDEARSFRGQKGDEVGNISRTSHPTKGTCHQTACLVLVNVLRCDWAGLTAVARM